ncbi:uncharacterized protein [Erythrolamprus reginae]|uniref:uncharacterized protein n=1 Tax=Erythrolamprus reginae TaxID=121349 RepID=UPI00396C96C6
MMTFFLQMFLLACFVATIQTKIYRRCELAHVFKKNGLDGYEGYSLASWICMAFYETGFDTKTIDRHKGGTKDYGIFHINSGLWCKENDSLSKVLCDIACSDLLNPDLEDDITCAKKMVQESSTMAVCFSIMAQKLLNFFPRCLVVCQSEQKLMLLKGIFKIHKLEILGLENIELRHLQSDLNVVHKIIDHNVVLVNEYISFNRNITRAQNRFNLNVSCLKLNCKKFNLGPVMAEFYNPNSFKIYELQLPEYSRMLAGEFWELLRLGCIAPRSPWNLLPSPYQPFTWDSVSSTQCFLGMKYLLLLSLLICLSFSVGGKIFGRCELAQVLKKAGLEGYRGYTLGDWVCLAFYESHFDSALEDHEADGSTSNGIFQINSHIWCEDYKHRKPNICQMHCSDLLTSNINDDIVCAMRIAQGPRGLGSWMGWRENCEGLRLSVWLKGCKL